MVLVVDPQIAGISGDMLLCSLVDLGADKTRIIEGVQSCSQFLSGSTIRSIDFQKNNKNGISSVELILQIDGEPHQRPGSELKDAVTLSVDKLAMSSKATIFAKSCIDSLINSESIIHGVSAESVHLHEASSIDTLVDIIGVSIALDDLHLFDEEIVCLPIAVGSGSVTFSHGTMSNPASAVLEILGNSGMTIHGTPIQSELTTPTGASMLKNLVTTPMDYYPYMNVTSVGYGSGKKNFESFSNVLKLVRGSTKHISYMDHVKILETNVDDVSGEVLGGLVDKIMNLGAKDVSIYSGITKKSRPTSLILVMCDDSSLEKIIDTLISETGTLGVRIRDSERLVLPRTSETITVDLGGRSFQVRYKTSSFKGKTRHKIEFDDLNKISNSLNLSIMEIKSLISKEIEKNGDANDQS